MKKIIFLLIVLVLVVGCVKQAQLEDWEKNQAEPLEIKQAEESQVIAPDLGREVGEVNIKGDGQGAFIGDVMNQMVNNLNSEE